MLQLHVILGSTGDEEFSLLWISFITVIICYFCCYMWWLVALQIQTLSGEGVLTRWQQLLKAAGVRRSAAGCHNIVTSNLAANSI
jgi:hypothetical protein